MWNRDISSKKQGVICLLHLERSLVGQLSCVLQQVPLFKKIVSFKASNENNQVDRKFDLWGEKKGRKWSSAGEVHNNSFKDGGVNCPVSLIEMTKLQSMTQVTLWGKKEIRGAVEPKKYCPANTVWGVSALERLKNSSDKTYVLNKYIYSYVVQICKKNPYWCILWDQVSGIINKACYAVQIVHWHNTLWKENLYIYY